jgi:hypothetical protein
LLREKSEDYKVITQDADASLGCLAATRYCGDSVCALADRGEDVEFDGGLQRGRLLVCVESRKYRFGIGMRVTGN